MWVESTHSIPCFVVFVPNDEDHIKMTENRSLEVNILAWTRCGLHLLSSRCLAAWLLFNYLRFVHVCLPHAGLAFHRRLPLSRWNPTPVLQDRLHVPRVVMGVGTVVPRGRMCTLWVICTV